VWRVVLLALAPACGRISFDSQDAVSAGEAVLGSNVGDVPGDTRDTFLRLEDPDDNFGGCEYVMIDPLAQTMRALIRIDTAAIPPGTAITSAELVVWTVRSDVDAGGDSFDGSFAAYGMLQAWNEGNTCSASGAASWRQAAPGVDWAMLGADAPARDTAVIGGLGTPIVLDTEYAMSLSPDVVQGWIDDPASNFGLVIVGSEGFDDGFTIVSREGPSGQRPRLRVRL
jgi:hypothetical protein